MQESKLEKKLCHEVACLGGQCIKLLSVYENGLPDRLILLPGGKVVFVEVKSIKGKLSLMQLINHDSLRHLGFEVFVIYNDDDLEKLVSYLKVNI